MPMLPLPIDSPATLGQALRAARKHLALTQPQLAHTAGVGVRFIVDLEAGKPTVQLGKVMRVLHSLGGSVQLGGLPGRPSTAPPEVMP
jgi:HTH-type transcriptional regulator / antitoxin HipB